MSYTRILVGTDGSDTAALAVLCASGLAKATGAELLVVSAFGRGGEASADAALEKAATSAQDFAVHPRPVKQEGSPEDVVVKIAERELADLIVAGNKGMDEAKRFRLGGVPDKISHASPCDLLIVQTTTAKPEDRWVGRYERILVATDGSQTAAEAVRKGVDLASRVGASVTLIYVGDQATGESVLEETAERRSTATKVDTLVVQGDITEKIVETAEQDKFDLLVIGNKGMTGAKKLLGSVPNSISHAATCDVLIAQTVAKSLADLRPGEGAIVNYMGRNLAAFMDEGGTLHASNPKCTHLGCTVGWNPEDKTWDCPCHGSRYNFKGEVMEGPALKSLEPEEIG